MLGYIRNICHRLYSTVHISCCLISFWYCSFILFSMRSLSPFFSLMTLLFYFLLVRILLFLPPNILFLHFSIFAPFILSWDFSILKLIVYNNVSILKLIVYNNNVSILKLIVYNNNISILKLILYNKFSSLELIVYNNFSNCMCWLAALEEEKMEGKALRLRLNIQENQVLEYQKLIQSMENEAQRQEAFSLGIANITTLPYSPYLSL